MVKKEVVKWLNHDIIYPIPYSEWVNPIQIVPKKTEITVVKNDKEELIPTGIQPRWRVCIDYKKLNSAPERTTFLTPFGSNAREVSRTGFLLLS